MENQYLARKRTAITGSLLGLTGLLLGMLGALAAEEVAETDPHREWAGRLVETLDWENEMQDKFFRNIEVLKKTLTAGDLPEEQQAALASALEEGLTEIWQKLDLAPLHEELVRTYQNIFTKAELKELVQFWESPLGQRWRVSGESAVSALEEPLRTAMVAHLPLLQERILAVLEVSDCCDDPHHHHHH